MTEDTMTVDYNGHQFVVSTSQASPVPPIAGLLLQYTEFNLNEWSHDDLEELQMTITNRVLERNEETTSNAIKDVIHGALDEETFEMTEPDANLTSNSNPARHLQVKRTRDNSDSLSVEKQNQSSQKHRRVSYHSALDKDASIVELLRDDPDLLNHFLKIRQSSASRSSTRASTDDKCSDAGARHSAVQTSDQPSKYAFTPRQDKQHIHDQITAEGHILLLLFVIWFGRTLQISRCLHKSIWHSLWFEGVEYGFSHGIIDVVAINPRARRSWVKLWSVEPNDTTSLDDFLSTLPKFIRQKNDPLRCQLDHIDHDEDDQLLTSQHAQNNYKVQV
ncbi:unnamed protein product [Phytophthora fragariaefolia]|uniref:Unnamed protein product n=1 Tax=Phytophthora fragariaefolia TaxID=1490495 RepID=A0A9W6YM80_9STRA|nr:unnamed protein product [Phytophthora fragariaefolia]